MLVFDFGAMLYGITLPVAAPGDHAGSPDGPHDGHDALPDVAAAPLGSLAGGALATGIGLRATLLVVGGLGIALALAPPRGRRCAPIASFHAPCPNSRLGRNPTRGSVFVPMSARRRGVLTVRLHPGAAPMARPIPTTRTEAR
jgi:hypothetical protein